MSSWEDMFYGSLSVMSVERIDDFHIVRFVHDDGDTATCRSFSENDIVLLTKDPPQKSNHDVHMVGKVYCSLGMIYLGSFFTSL
jgi:senataxin